MTRCDIVHVVHSLHVGGTENGLVNLVNGLRHDRAHAVIAMTEAGPLAARLPRDVKVHALGKRQGQDFRALARMTSLLRRLRPTIVHSRNWASFDAIFAARLARVPVVIHGEHGREASDPEGRNRRRNRLRRLAAPLVTRFVTVSDDLRRWLVESVRVPERKVTTICNGVDADRFSPAPGAPVTAAREIGPRGVVVGTVGRLDPVKDQAGLIRAFAMLGSEHHSASLVVAGDGPCRAELEALRTSLGLGDRVRLLGERRDVADVLRSMDIFVLPSIAEGISNTILEAMATGLPIVATNVGGNAELVEDGINGFLVPRQDPVALARAIGAYLEDGNLRAVHGKSSRQRVLDHFSLERMQRAYVQLYSDVTAHRALRSA